MTPDERDRLAKAEQQVADMKDDIAEIKGDLKKLVAAANMAGGGWLAIMKLGGTLVMAAGFLGWLYDHTIGRGHP